MLDSLELLDQHLSANGEAGWASAIRNIIAVRDTKSVEEAARLAKGLFGGMGSLSDLVLQSTAAANSELERLQDRLFQEAGQAISP